MFHATGVGQHEILYENSAARIIEALLYNFDFDDFYGHKIRPLKPAHTKFLDEHVIPLLEGGKGHIWIQGSASRIGTSDWNMTLSQVREGSVQAYLLDNGVNADQIEVNAVGSSLTAHHALDDDRDRSVLIWVYPNIDHKPPTKKVPKRPKTSTTFRIAVDGSYPPLWKRHHDHISWGGKIVKKIVKKLPISARDIPFIIWDTTNNLACKYIYIGVEFGFDLSIGSSLPEPHGPWTDFTTEKAIGCWQFGRDGRLTTMGDWKTAATYIHIETPAGVKNVHAKIQLGIAVKGAQGSTTLAGDFDLMSRPEPFGGP
ncbi:OmpA family protein [Labrys neptuniae]